MRISEPGLSTDIANLEKWAKHFRVIGHPVRLAIILMLNGSEVLRHTQHSLTFSEIKSISSVPSDENLCYHLRELSIQYFRSRPLASPSLLIWDYWKHSSICLKQ
jgi:hypothetical protein